MGKSASTAEQQRISAMDRETEARWQRVIIEENPAFSRLMGVRFTSGSRDRIEAELTVGEDLANRNGVMHGGAIMAFADILGGAASMLNLPDGARTTTIGSKTHFADPAWPRPLLQARRYEEAGHHEPISDIVGSLLAPSHPSGQFSEAQPDQGLRLSLLARLVERRDKGGRGRRVSTAKGDQG